jgi:aspartokinase
MPEQRVKIGGIIEKHDLAKISMFDVPDRSELFALIFEVLGEQDINCPFIVQTTGREGLSTVVLCITRARLPDALAALEAVKEDCGARELAHCEDVSVVSIFGPHFGERSGIAGAMFAALAGAGLEIQAVSTTISSLSCVLDAQDADRALAALKEAFELP